MAADGEASGDCAGGFLFSVRRYQAAVSETPAFKAARLRCEGCGVKAAVSDAGVKAAVSETPVFKAAVSETPVFKAAVSETPVFKAAVSETPV
ncbi:MAG: hypothetical protein LBK00_05915, partial [Treponema sp.]|nr:hypothetical protein [Treponema sp.]